MDQGTRAYNRREVYMKFEKENRKQEVAELDSKLDKVSVKNPSEAFAKPLSDQAEPQVTSPKVAMAPSPENSKPA